MAAFNSRLGLAFLSVTLLLLSPGVDALAADTGLYIDVKESEAPDARVVERWKLYGSSHALVIGVDDYTGGWPKLNNAVMDARVVAEELADQGFKVTLKTDLDANELRDSLRNFFAITGEDPEARLLLWYAGHGHTIGDEGFLVPADAPPANQSLFKVKALHMRDFGGLMRLANSKHVLAVFDSCFSGTIFTARAGANFANITHKTKLPVRQFITSGEAGQRVRDDGSFRKLFIRAIRGEENADANADGYVTGEELGLHLTQRMTNLTQAAQTPRAGRLQDVDFDQGDFVFQLSKLKAPAQPFAQQQAPEPQKGRDTDLELALWQAIKGSQDPRDYQDYLAQFPEGTFAGLAHRTLASLSEQTATPEPPVSAPAATQLAVGSYPKTTGAEFVDCDVCPVMVPVEAGSFSMGSPVSEKGRLPREGPPHDVTISRPFAVGKFEVTKGQFAAFVNESGHHSQSCFSWKNKKWKKDPSRSWKDPGYVQSDGHPVTCVSWEDARAYLSWLSHRTGRSYRLLSEAEWEYVARAGTTEAWNWGPDTDQTCLHANSFDLTSKSKFDWPGVVQCEDRHVQTSPVGVFRANAFGLHDLLGNLWEWVEDCWNPDYQGAPKDGSAWTRGDCSKRILRGGSWVDGHKVLRSSYRFRRAADLRVSNFGFRVARDLDR